MLMSISSVEEVSLMSKTIVQNWIGHRPEARRSWPVSIQRRWANTRADNAEEMRHVS